MTNQQQTPARRAARLLGLLAVRAVLPRVDGVQGGLDLARPGYRRLLELIEGWTVGFGQHPVGALY